MDPGWLSLLISALAFAVAVYSLRRDRAILRVRDSSGAAGSLLVIIDNVGLRPVRITRVIQARHPRFPLHSAYDLTEYAGAHRPGQSTDSHFPLVLEPNDELTLQINNHLLARLPGRIGVEDAGGRQHWPSYPRRRYKRIAADSIFEEKLRVTE
jgi:hypothetical protein